MEGKSRSSLDEHGATAASALRRMTRSPAHHFNIGRLSMASSTSSTSSTFSAVETNSDVEVEVPLSCVSQETNKDECGLHRFIVWAAVKRNDCHKMTPEERKECPLLRCRKRFPDHELMLQHLYTCAELEAAEYWCYDHGRVERFNDSKCRRCLGHPSKRKKIVSMAKSFFSSLGNKARTGSTSEADVNMDEAPPSYDSIPIPIRTPIQAELSCNEVYEMDSSEERLPTIAESIAESVAEPTPRSEPAPEQMPATSTVPFAPIALHPAELESAPTTALDSLINWEPSPTLSPVVPDYFMQRDQTKSPEKPILQLHTRGLDVYRSRPTRRSKNLVHSSSVRSTASTMSTNSTMSTPSCTISPMSAWSGGWVRAPGFDSTLTSPADDLDSAGDSYPPNIFSMKTNKLDICSDGMYNPPPDLLLSELPGNLPMLSPYQHSLPKDSIMDPLAFSFDAAIPTELSIESNLAITEGTEMPLVMQPLLVEPGVYTLVESVRETLQTHIADSIDKLPSTSQSRVVKEFQNMPASEVTQRGLDALTSIMIDATETSPTDVICFVHMVYSLSLVLHEQDAPSRSASLFSQALSYGSRFSGQHQIDYLHTVICLWKPPGMTSDELGMLLDAHKTSSVRLHYMSEKRKGKQIQQDYPSPANDHLMSVTQCFLDELERAALQDSTDPEIQISSLSLQHMKDVSIDAQHDSPYSIAVRCMLNMLYKRYPNVPNFTASICNIVNRFSSSCISTPRRLELELMHVGRIHLPPSTFLDDYMVQVRKQIDSLCAQDLRFNPRVTYHRQAIELFRSIIAAQYQRPSWEDVATTESAFGTINDFMGSLAPEGDISFDFADANVGPSQVTSQAVPIPAIIVDAPQVDDSLWLLGPGASSPLGGGTQVGPSSPQPPFPDPPHSKSIESDSCCELCGYRPKGDPRWFGGSMAKHKKLQHATTPAKIYRCEYPGCTSQYRNRPDNLRQHQLEKKHFVDGQEESGRRPNKRKRT
ncbi:hypothetical protein S40285_05731 [Stachybotrys chlorohalonatus IBT 40285]|uniref:Uncharacterized protein n=1 Tax=Stachybotrys chlorohalonatus (strain IBT 40285) TaxID=1283841 RepID=A0A084QJ25_STAC4|nr:hypothetical protein S40285_05731 [Stachybotrys chlorohalonata IBT 40285]